MTSTKSAHHSVILLLVVAILGGCVGSGTDDPTGEAVSAATAASITTWISVLTPDLPGGVLGPEVLDIRGVSTADGAPAQLWLLRTTGEFRNQRWTITQQPGTSGGHPYYELKNQLSGKCLEMAIDIIPVENGEPVVQSPCNHSNSQRWAAVPVESGSRGKWVELSNLESNLCLDVSHVNYADGALLQVWECHGGWNQRWNIF